jgi:hypothetical protein
LFHVSVLLTGYAVVATACLYICGINILVIFSKKPLFVFEKTPKLVKQQDQVNIAARVVMDDLKSFIHNDLANMGIDMDELMKWKNTQPLVGKLISDYPVKGQGRFETIIIDGCEGTVHVLEN